MRKMVVASKQASTERGDSMTLIYAITVDEVAVEGSVAELECYGIGVEIPEYSESVYIRAITPSAAMINKLAGVVSTNLVTPCTLFDVVCDWVSGE